MEVGGETMERIVTALERSAVAQEELIRLATEERDVGDALLEFSPPTCPHCGRIDPAIRNEGGVGQMSEFVLVAHCQSCAKTFLAISRGWDSYRDKDEYERREDNDSS